MAENKPEEPKLGALVDRNTEVITKLFDEDPSKILVAVQTEEDQIAYLQSGLTKRSRRLIPLTVFARLVSELLKKQ